MVSLDKPRVECYSRQGEHSWRFTDTEGLDATFTIPSFEIELTLAQVYTDISFAPDV